jgi:DinB superfamily
MMAPKSCLYFFWLGRPAIITGAERNAMFARFLETRDLVHRTAHGLTPAQLQYRPGVSRWSVAENLEHITIVEQHILAGLTRTLQKAPDPAKKPAMTDEQLLANFGRVVQPITAPEPLRLTSRGPCDDLVPLRPTSRWPLSNLLNEFDAPRQRTVEFATTAADTKELRHYFMPHPLFGELDCYQWFIIAAGHSERHCNQCAAIKASADFPH